MSARTNGMLEFDRREAQIRRGDVTLAARLSLPGPGCPVVVFVHGLGSSKDSPRNVVIAERLVEHGIGALLFDLSGHGESSGPAQGTLAEYVADLAAAEAWVAQQPGVDPARIAVAGSSLGAVVALAAATAGGTRAVALVLRAPPAEPEAFAGLAVPTLLVVGSHDSLVNRARAAAAVCSAVQLHVVPGASHLFEEPGTLEEATRVTVDWLHGTLAPGP